MNQSFFFDFDALVFDSLKEQIFIVFLHGLMRGFTLVHNLVFYFCIKRRNVVKGKIF